MPFSIAIPMGSLISQSKRLFSSESLIYTPQFVFPENSEYDIVQNPDFSGVPISELAKDAPTEFPVILQLDTLTTSDPSILNPYENVDPVITKPSISTLSENIFIAGSYGSSAVMVTDAAFPDEDLIISAGNFHGQPLALALDNLCIAMAELGSISECRTYQLIAGKRGLPSFLVANPGLNSGFMIPQYTAASIVSRNKQLCTPASVDTVPSSQGQEDHVSMGANAATKAYQVAENLERILAIELFNAAQALEFQRPAKSSPFIENFVEGYRKKVKFIEHDKTMYDDIAKSVEYLREVALDLQEK